MANTEWAFPFADNNGDRMYSDADFAKFFSAWFVNGVFINVGGGLQLVDSINGGMRITLKSGAANINGRVYYLNGDTEFTVPVALSTQDRTDSVVLRLDLSARTMSTIYKQSDTSLVRNDSTYEIQLAKINVNKNISEITQSMITDMRTDKNVCGLASPNDPIDVDNFISQFKLQFNEQLNNNNADFISWFSNLKSQLDSNQASNFQNQINTNKDNIDLKLDKAENSKIKSWEKQKDYKVGDFIFVSNVGYRNSGKLTNAVLRCLVDHTSGDTFPSSSENKWFLINKEAYLISILSQFGFGRNANITRNGNNVKFAYLAVAGRQNIPKRSYLLDEKLPIWANPTHEFSDNDDPAVYVNGFDMYNSDEPFGLSLHRTDGSKIGFYAYTNIPASWVLRCSATYITDAEEQWQGGEVS